MTDSGGTIRRDPLAIKIRRLHSGAILPRKANPSDAGFDLSVPREPIPDLRIGPGLTIRVPLGIAWECPRGWYGSIVGRSSLNARGLFVIQGSVDCDFRGEFRVVLHNARPNPAVVRGGDRIAQLLVLPVPDVDVVEANELEDSERGMGGFGSTGR